MTRPYLQDKVKVTVPTLIEHIEHYRPKGIPPEVAISFSTWKSEVQIEYVLLNKVRAVLYGTLIKGDRYCSSLSEAEFVIFKDWPLSNFHFYGHQARNSSSWSLAEQIFSQLTGTLV